MAREPYQVGNFKGHVANSDHTLHEMIHGARNGFYRVIKEKYGADPIDVRTIIDDFYKKLHTVQQPPNPPMGPPHRGPTTIRVVASKRARNCLRLLMRGIP